MPKESGVLEFIQNMQPANKVTIKKIKTRLLVDEVAKVFVGFAIYSRQDLYLDYNQFQLGRRE